MIPVHLITMVAHNSKARQPATMVLEFPAPHIAVFKPNPALARLRKFGMVAAIVAVLVAAGLVMMKMQMLDWKFKLKPSTIPSFVIPIFMLGVFGLSVIVRRKSAATRCVTFDRRQGMVSKEARKLEPIWQGGIRLRDVASLEVTTTPARGMTSFSLDMVMSRPHGQRARLIAHGNREAMKADAVELARFLNIPLKDQTA